MNYIKTFNESVEHKFLLDQHRRLVGEFEYQLSLYRELQNYFNGRKPDEAEMRYYSDKCEESGFESEGLFSLHHKSLKEKMRENKIKRNEISKQISEIKQKLKDMNR